MATADRVFWLHALTPLHVGAGRGEGYIDLPLIKEKVTGFPFVPGSAVKGVFADECRATDTARDPSSGVGYDPKLHAAFGRAGDETANAGAFVFTDARLVCLPMRSLHGTFAWCTSSFVLLRLARDLVAAGLRALPEIPASAPFAYVPSMTSKQDQLVSDSRLVRNDMIYLNDLDIPARANRETSQWAQELGKQLFEDVAWQNLFRERFVILPDEVFNFVTETGTEVQPHVRIDDDFKRVQSGALWYEESLPAESILCGLLWCDSPRIANASVSRQDVLALIRDKTLQLGGKATTGKGRVKLSFRSLGDA